MTGFRRTPTGKAAKYLFHPNEVLVWVEGDDDLSAYDWMVRGLNCRLEPAGGKPECLKLADELAQDDLGFVVVVDGDYDILTRRRSQHRRVVWLFRHSVENYLAEEEDVIRLCDSIRAPVDSGARARFKTMLRQLEKDLEELVVLDVAAVRSGACDSPLPGRAEPLLPGGRGCALDPGAVAGCCGPAAAVVPKNAVREAKELIADWKSRSRMVHITKGHVVIGMVRQFIRAELSRRGHKWVADQRTLLVLLGAEVWNGTVSADHASLRRRLKRAVRDVS